MSGPRTTVGKVDPKDPILGRGNQPRVRKKHVLRFGEYKSVDLRPVTEITEKQRVLTSPEHKLTSSGKEGQNPGTKE